MERPGQNPWKRVIEAVARAFGVPPAFFFDDYDPQAVSCSMHAWHGRTVLSATLAVGL